MPTTHPSMLLMTVGEIVRTLRGRRNLEQVELANACGWRDASAVSRIETDRVRPTRRTLLKLAEALSDRRTTGSKDRIAAVLFLAAGVTPEGAEVAAVRDSTPALHDWPQPAALLDFSWTVWDANRAFRRALGLRRADVGRNLLASIFDPSSPLRRDSDTWHKTAEETVAHFRADTHHQGEMRWTRNLLAKLQALPDFTTMWQGAPPTGTPSLLDHTWESQTKEGTWRIAKMPLSADPRLWVYVLLAETVPGLDVLARLRAPAAD